MSEECGTNNCIHLLVPHSSDLYGLVVMTPHPHTLICLIASYMGTFSTRACNLVRGIFLDLWKTNTKLSTPRSPLTALCSGISRNSTSIGCRWWPNLSPCFIVYYSWIVPSWRPRASGCGSMLYSTTSRNRNLVNKNQDRICLRVPHRKRNSHAWVLPTLSVCPASVDSM